MIMWFGGTKLASATEPFVGDFIMVNGCQYWGRDYPANFLHSLIFWMFQTYQNAVYQRDIMFICYTCELWTFIVLTIAVNVKIFGKYILFR